MIHKIKGLYDDGRGLSIRAISQELGVSRNTVRKYLRMDEQTVCALQSDRSRTKRLDLQRDYIAYLLDRYPRLTAVKIARKLREKLGDLDVSERSLRRYVQQMKRTVATAQQRYYEPVLDLVPGVQCQVDPGELRGVVIGSEERTVHFVVFVLAYSRLMHVGVSLRPIDTTTFMHMHDEAFRAFGGVPEECVYDQTKMVVISEQFRELTVNERFHAYATAAGVRIHACQGYDPESKGKVEAGVKYVKRDGLYGETFADEQALRAHLQHWLDTVANERYHGTTGRAPRELFEAEERAHLGAYLTPRCLTAVDPAATARKVDKTGLIAWRANKYSVPMRYQQGRVGVVEDGTTVQVIDLETGEVVATHGLCTGKGETVRNTHHYRDHAQRVADLEASIQTHLGSALGEQLCGQLKATDPRIYKDQLRGVRELLRRYPQADAKLLAELAERPGTSASTVKHYLEASERADARGRDDVAGTAAASRLPDTGLEAYARLGRPSGHPEVTHEPA
ncbi:IS21 family transposase [Aquisalimonas sp. APHAB1-3]|uniref:IS21 family transposase n=1 Tax=Aquisalimonas sp. APHAB1-3 TaxID=3402080 RepID=UPI003AADC926